MTVKDIYTFLDDIAPFEMQVSYDNSSIIIGSKESDVSKIGVCLDITHDVADYCIDNKIDLIICHHPLIFSAIKKISALDVTYKLIKNGISVIAAHTNLDCAKNGVCESLCKALNIKITDNAFADDFPNIPLGRIGELDEKLSADDFAKFIKQRLNAPDIRYSAFTDVKKIGVFNGSGADMIDFAIKCGADSVITSEVKHHQWIFANENKINVFDAGHFSTEYVITDVLTSAINEKFGNIAQNIEQTAPYKAI